MGNRFLFRGKRLDNGEWLDGDLATVYLYPRVFIVSKGENKVNGMWETVWLEVDPETVGQLVKRCKRYDIYDGDILQDDSTYYLVTWDEEECGFVAIDLADGCLLWMSEVQKAWVVGNKWDNPELLEVE